MSTRRWAFTLIEMLVVVAVIVLIISLLLPGLGRARDTARELLCQTRMGQVSHGTISYAHDNRGEFPANRFRPNPAVNQHVTWRHLVVKGNYVGDGDIWLCPQHPTIAAKSEMNISIHGSQCIGDVAKANYAYNGSAFWRFSPNGAPDGAHPYPTYGIPNEKSELTLRNTRNPQLTFILLETRDTYPDIGDWAKNWNVGDGGGIIGFWHRRGANWAIADGSVIWAKILDTANPQCRWHNFPEPNDPHLDWAGQVPAIYQ